MLNSDELESRIRAEYSRSGNSLGWRFLASPVSVLNGAEVAFIGLNPGGGEIPPDHPEFAMKSGSAYSDERWGAYAKGQNPLQKQVQALFRRLGQAPERVLSGNFVPFRSPDWASLPNKQEALQFGHALWREVLSDVQPRLVICMGIEVFRPLNQLLGVSNPKRIPVGWGNITGEYGDTKYGSLVRLPHLSRFGIVTRRESQSSLKAMFGDMWTSD